VELKRQDKNERRWREINYLNYVNIGWTIYG
jgi:hypothetical protein